MEIVFLPFALFIPFIILLLVIVPTIFWIWMIVDCAVNEPPNDNNKIVWILIILFTHFLGALIYFLVRRQQRIMECGR